jgi:hypothetical protein
MDACFRRNDTHCLYNQANNNVCAVEDLIAESSYEPLIISFIVRVFLGFGKICFKFLTDLFIGITIKELSCTINSSLLPVDKFNFSLI